MPRLKVNGCNYFYTEAGRGPEAILFGPGFLLTHLAFAPQIEALQKRYRCVTLDWRGQGRSEITEGNYSPPALARDAARVIQRLGLGPCHYVGFSMGGYVGYHIALQHSDLLQSLTLVDTTARAEPFGHRLQYTLMLLVARVLGYPELLLQRVLSLLFGPVFLNDPSQQDEIERWKSIIASNDRRGIFRAGLGIFYRESVFDRLPEIKAPTLIVVGENDALFSVERARAERDLLSDARLEVIPEAGHSTPIEQPDAVTDVLRSFLGAHATDSA